MRASAATKAIPDLTGRESQIVRLIWDGQKNSEIGKRLKISVKTVEAHRANIMKKWRVSNVAQMLRIAVTGKVVKIA